MNEEILTKIRKLLATANDQCNEHESEIALRMATRLMVKHGIDESMLELETTGKLELGALDGRLIHRASRVTAWRVELADVLAERQCCRIGIASGFGIYIYGHETNWNRIQELWNLLEPQVDKWAKSQRGKGRRFANSYRLGMVETLGKLLVQEKNKLVAEKREEALATSDATAMVVMDQLAVVEKAARRDVDKLVNEACTGGEWRGGGGFSDAGYTAGQRDGWLLDTGEQPKDKMLGDN